MIALYLILGLALVGGLYWSLTQITGRQRRLNAELARLEQLAAEVSLNAGALLERVDDRAERLSALLAAVEARAGALTAAVPPAGEASAPAAPPPAAKKRGRPRKQAAQETERVPAAEPVIPAEPAPATPASIQRYQELRTAVWSLADQGKDAAAIAQEVGVPRGEIQLLLNIRTKKVTA